MTDGDPPLQPRHAGPLADQLQLPYAERPAVMKMNIDQGAMSLGQAENAVEMAYRIAVHSRRVDPSDGIDAFVEGPAHQLGRSRLAQDPVLRERDQLYVDPAVQAPDPLAHGLDAAQTELGSDVHM